MDLRECLDDYEVTAIPPRATTLSLIWSEAPDADADGADNASPDAVPSLAILDDYRITRIPGRAAS